MTDAPDTDEDRMLAAEYALGLLSVAEARAFEARLTADPVLRADYAIWAEDFADMAAAVAAEPPPAGTFRAIEARLFPDERRNLWQRLGLMQALLGAAVAALLLLAVTNLGWLTEPPMPTLGAQIAAADRSLVVLARFDPASGALTIERQAGTPLPDRTQELWLIAGQAAPVSLGLLAAAGPTRLTLSAEMAALLDGAVLAISDEPPGGSPTGQPTGAVLATGAVAAVL